MKPIRKTLRSSLAAMVAVAVTEPDHGSDASGIRTVAQPVSGGYLLTGVKTWCTFAGKADVLMVVARTGGACPVVAGTGLEPVTQRL